MLELMLAMALIGILSAVLLNRLSYYQEAAEKANMEYTIATLKGALRFRIANMLTAGKGQEIASLANENPMDWLSLKPENYLDRTTVRELDGNWYFDSRNETLVYTVKSHQYFKSHGAGGRTVRLKVNLIRNLEPVAMNKTSTSPVVSASLDLFETYSWF